MHKSVWFHKFQNVSYCFLVLKLNHMDERRVVGPPRAVSGDWILFPTMTNTSFLQDKDILADSAGFEFCKLTISLNSVLINRQKRAKKGFGAPAEFFSAGFFNLDKTLLHFSVTDNLVIEHSQTTQQNYQGEHSVAPQKSEFTTGDDQFINKVILIIYLFTVYIGSVDV
jgi:hypothetical protein